MNIVIITYSLIKQGFYWDVCLKEITFTNKMIFLCVLDVEKHLFIRLKMINIKCDKKYVYQIMNNTSLIRRVLFMQYYTKPRD